MGVVVSNLLKTKDPDDLKRVLDYIIEETRLQSLKDTGSDGHSTRMLGVVIRDSL